MAYSTLGVLTTTDNVEVSWFGGIVPWVDDLYNSRQKKINQNKCFLWVIELN